MMKNRGKSLFLVSLTLLICPTDAAVPILLLEKFSNIQLLFFNSLAGLLIIIPIILYQKKTEQVKIYLKKSDDVIKLMFMGFIGVFSYLILLYKAYKILPVQITYPINLLWPVMTVIFTILLLRKKILKKQLLGISIAFIGVLLVISQGEIHNFQKTNQV